MKINDLKKIVYLLLLLINSVIISACTTLLKKDTVQEEPYKYYYTESKLIINDLKAKSSQNLNADVFILKGQKLRLELTGPLNYNVGSILIDSSDFKMLIYNKKRYYYGKLSNDVLTPLIPLPINPKILEPVLLGDFQSTKDWKCKEVQGPALSVYRRCANLDLGLSLQWKNTEDQKKKIIVIKSKTYEISWLVHDFSTEVEYRKQVFTLEPPADFKLIQLQ